MLIWINNWKMQLRNKKTRDFVLFVIFWRFLLLKVLCFCLPNRSFVNCDVRVLVLTGPFANILTQKFLTVLWVPTDVGFVTIFFFVFTNPLIHICMKFHRDFSIVSVFLVALCCTIPNAHFLHSILDQDLVNFISKSILRL